MPNEPRSEKEEKPSAKPEDRHPYSPIFLRVLAFHGLGCVLVEAQGDSMLRTFILTAVLSACCDALFRRDSVHDPPHWVPPADRRRTIAFSGSSRIWTTFFSSIPWKRSGRTNSGAVVFADARNLGFFPICSCFPPIRFFSVTEPAAMLLRTRNHAAFVSLSLGLTLVQAAFMPPLPLSYGYTQTFSFANQNNFSAPIAGAQTAFDGTVDGNMTLYFLSRNNVYAVHMLPPFVPYVFAGVADSCCTISNPTLATQAIFTYPEGILFDCHSRYLYVADTGGRCIWRIDTQPMAATVSSFSGDCHTGSASVNDGIGVAGLYKAPRHLALWGADVMV